MANYPNSQPTLTDPISTDYLTSPAHAELHSSENAEIEAIALELGTLTKGAYGDVTARLDASDAILATKVGSIVGAALEFTRYNVTSDGLEASGYTESDFAPIAHISSSDHDSRYYTETEADNLLGAKMDLVVGATLDNFASSDGAGQIVDSTYGSSSFDAAGTSAAGIAAHAATHTISIEHNPFVVGTKNVDETDIADNQILFFHFESNTIRYGAAAAIQQEQIEDWVAALIQDGVGPLVWTYDDAGGTLTGNLPQGIDTTDTPQFVTVNIGGNYSFPTADGANTEVMQTDGAGTVTWQPIGGIIDVQNSSIRHYPYALGGM